MNALYPGCVAPVKTVVVVQSDDADFDLSTATGGRIIAVFADDSTKTWDADMSGATETEITLTRVHEADDIADGSEGTCYIRGEVDIPASANPIVTNSRAVPIVKLGA